MLPEIKIASPCPARWEQMTGDNRARHCTECDLDVYNFSEMTSAEIEELIAASAGQRLCGRIYQRADGTILTRDCPVGLRAKIRRVSRRLTGALAAAMSLVFAGQAISQQSGHTMGIPVYKQTGFNLTVLDTSGTPIPHAEIFMFDPKTHKTVARGMTDKLGKFTLSHAVAGDYTVVVNATPFVARSAPVSIKPNEMHTITIGLKTDLPFINGLIEINPALPTQIKRVTP
jgi:hypothetical protein